MKTETSPTVAVHQVISKLDRRYKYGEDKGIDLGLNIKNNWRKRTTLYIYGADYSGKSRLFFFCSLVAAEKHGWKFCVFSPETGAAEDIYALLIQMYCGNKNFDNSQFGITKAQYDKAVKFLEKHFRIIAEAKDTQHIFDLVKETEEQGFKADCLVLDPFNAVDHDIGTRPRDVYLGSYLTAFDYDAVKNDRLNVIVVHPQNQELQKTDGLDGSRLFYYPIVEKRQIMWGQEWARKGKNMWSVWRPKFNMPNDNGGSYAKGEVVVDVQKVKPDVLGEIGKYRLFFDVHTQRYYNDENFQNCPLVGAFEAHERPTEQKIKPNNQFLRDETEEDIPF
jgi:hypothetical protein